ncbi:MAG: putative MFS-type transporter YhjX [Syntrophaceae bacterium PtaU1.Bin231]|nr:MAG: putative MFS-type transporter YhjX [Syntrophaceae bacterium PtaU1.Bin231]
MAPQHTGKRPFYGWRNVVICFICYCMVYGVVFYGFSVVFPAMVKAMAWKRGDASIAHTIRALLVAFGSPLCGYMIGRWGVRATLLSGGVLIIAGMTLAGTVMTELWQWTILWGVVVGLGLSLCGVIGVQTNVTNWFNKNRGMAMGIVLTGAALGGFVAQPLFTWIMKQFGQWQVGWIAGAVFSLIGVVVVIWLKNKPEDYGQYQDGISPEEAKATASEGPKKAKTLTYRTPVPWTLSEAVRTRQLWFLIYAVLMQIFPLYFLTTHGVFHMTGHGLTAMQAAYVLSFNVLGGAIARFPMGWLADRIEGRWLLTFCYVLIVSSMYVFWQAPSMTSLAVAATIFGFSYGAGFVLVPILVGSYFGAKNFHKIVSFMFPIEYGLGSLVPVGAGYIYDYTKSYDLFFMVMLTLIAVCIVCAFLTTPPQKKAKA